MIAYLPTSQSKCHIKILYFQCNRLEFDQLNMCKVQLTSGENEADDGGGYGYKRSLIILL